MGFELGRLVREAAGVVGSRLARAARDLRRRAQDEADRMWREVGARLRVHISAAIEEGRCGRGVRAEANLAVGPLTRVVTETITEVLVRSGYQAIQADVDGRPLPAVVHGTVRSHRPSVSAIGGGRPVYLDVYLPEESDPDEQISRWQLFASAASRTGGEFHVVVPAWIEGASGAFWARQVASATGLTITKVWEI